MKQILKFSLSLILIASISVTAFAHSGRIDAFSGHRDNSNASGLGSYHFHCRDTPAHLHVDGVCPYDETEPLYDRDLTVHFIDVGQGDSILIELPNYETILIDAGGVKAANIVLDYINGLEITKIDHLVATHPHEDHIGGLPAVINAFEIGKVYMPKATHTTQAYKNLLLAIERKELTVKNAIAGINIVDEEELTAMIIAPNSGTYKSLNNHSVVIRLVYGDTSFLFAGDAETFSEDEIFKAAKDFNADVLKVGHHGSSTSSSIKFLGEVKPSYAVIFCKDANDYGHPHKITLSKLHNIKATVYQTDLSGSVVIASDGINLEITTEK